MKIMKFLHFNKHLVLSVPYLFFLVFVCKVSIIFDVVLAKIILN